jgi:hypothetical protein
MKKIVPGEVRLGWPLIYYERFHVAGSAFDNYGWQLTNLLLDQLLYISLVVLFLLKRKTLRR